MIRVTKIQTRDGTLHDGERDAKRHAEKAYGDALLRLARELAQQKYSFVSEYIDSNLAAFIELKALKDDTQPPKNEDDIE